MSLDLHFTFGDAAFVTRNRLSYVPGEIIVASKNIHHEYEKKIDDLARELLECKTIIERLRKRESQKSAFLDSMTTNLIFVNDKLEIQWANSAAVDSIHLDVKEVRGLTCYALWADSDTPCDGCPALKTFKTGKTEQTIIRTSDGRVWDAKSEPVFDEQGKIIGVLEIAHNVTEKLRMEKQLTQIQKMNAVAGLAGGIAHQFNNALVGIIGNIELIQMTVDTNDKTNKYIDAMKETVNRMANLTSQLLAYARGGKYQAQKTSLNEFVKLLIDPVQLKKKPGIKIVERVSGSSHFVKIDPTQIEMAIIAVLSNAMEAIEDDGYIKIEIHREVISQDVAATNPIIKAGNFACLSIEDNGKGMAPEVLKRVFEPFFTTHFHGSGLSMAAVYGIVENHDGWIAIGSEPGKGTVVKIYLPVMDESASKDNVKDPLIYKVFKTVLLIEADETMMEVNRTMLENMGCHVLSARTSSEAVMISHTYKKDIDLILLDRDLPDKDGKDIFKTLKKVRPDAEIIIVDFPSATGACDEWADVDADFFLAKPFTKSQLKKIFTYISKHGAS